MKRMPVAAALVCAGMGTAQAADLSFDPSIGLTGVYNDNYRLSENPDNEVQVAGARLDALVAMRAETQRSRFQLTPRLISSRFPGDEDDEADDVFVRLLAETSTERMRARLDGAYSEVAIRGRYFPGATVSPDDVLGEPDRRGHRPARTQRSGRQVFGRSIAGLRP
jgi:opacity protein-like surface antigen